MYVSTGSWVEHAVAHEYFAKDGSKVVIWKLTDAFGTLEADSFLM